MAAGFPDRLRSVVEDAGGRLRAVRLDVSPQAQEERLGEASRHEFHKLTDVSVLRSLRAHSADVEWPAADLVIDTDHSSPEQSAATIVERFALSRQQPSERYPSTP